MSFAFREPNHKNHVAVAKKLAFSHRRYVRKHARLKRWSSVAGVTCTSMQDWKKALMKISHNASLTDEERCTMEGKLLQIPAADRLAFFEGSPQQSLWKLRTLVERSCPGLAVHEVLGLNLHKMYKAFAARCSSTAAPLNLLANGLQTCSCAKHLHSHELYVLLLQSGQAVQRTYVRKWLGLSLMCMQLEWTRTKVCLCVLGGSIHFCLNEKHKASSDVHSRPLTASCSA